MSITQVLKIRKIIGSFQIYAIFGICLHAVVCAVGIVIHKRGFKFHPAILQRPRQFPFAFNTKIAVYVGVEFCFVVVVLMIIGYPATDTVGPMIWHGHVPERTVTGVEATHIHLIHIGEGIAVSYPSNAMGCDFEKSLKDISAKDS